MKFTIEKWFSQPAMAKALQIFLASPVGTFLIALLRYHFRAQPMNLKIEPGVDYLQMNALMNRDREAWTQIIDFIEMLAIPREKKERLPDAGWATEPLRREIDKEPAPTPQPQPSPRKPSRKSKK